MATSVATPGADAVDDKAISRFRDDGVVCLRQVLAAEWLALLADGVDAAMTGEDRYTRRHRGEAGGLFFSDYWASDRVPALRRVALESPLGSVAGRLMEANRANFFYDSVFVKEPGTAIPSDWHQDQPYYCVDGRQVAICWMPLDPVGEDNALRCVRGSHRWGKALAPVFFGSGLDFGRGEAEGYARAGDIESACDGDIVSWAMEPGDVLVFHGMTVHGARGSRTRRRAVSMTWLGDDTTYIERPGEMEPHRRGLGLSQGDPLDGGAFPRVWSRGP